MTPGKVATRCPAQTGQKRRRHRHRIEWAHSIHPRRLTRAPPRRSYDRGHLQPQFATGTCRSLPIVTEVGPEILTGSSRMKAATAHKMVLNVISTGAMSHSVMFTAT